jgi:hypothetical protein
MIFVISLRLGVENKGSDTFWSTPKAQAEGLTMAVLLTKTQLAKSPWPLLMNTAAPDA